MEYARMASGHKSYDIVVVGGGAYGLSSAWHLIAADPALGILVLDATDFAANGTGRCVGGVRTLWGHESNIRMCQESVRFFEQATERLRYPEGIEFKQEGYLMLSWEVATMDRFRSVRPIHQTHQVPSEMLTAEDVLRISPGVNPEGLLGGMICRSDGALNPFRWLDGLLKDIRRRGVRVEYNRRVTRLDRTGTDFRVHLAGETCTAAKVILCTDWAAPELAAMLTVDLPVERVPVECMVTERWHKMLGPNHISMRHDMAINQLANGSIVINHGRARDKVDDITNRPDWFRRASRGAVEVVPALADLRVLRGWAGTISVTPDMQPIICETALRGLFVAVSAYKGLMTSPAAGRLVSDMVLGNAAGPIAPFVHLDRFNAGNLVREPMTNGAKLD